MLIQNHCPPWPIVTVSVLEYRPEVSKNLEKRYPERDGVASVLGGAPQGGGKAQWVRRAIRASFTIVKGKK